MKSVIMSLAAFLLIAGASPEIGLAGEDEEPVSHQGGANIRGFLSDLGYLLDEYGISREAITVFIQPAEKEEEKGRTRTTTREGRPALGCEWCHYGTVSDCCVGGKCGICWGF